MASRIYSVTVETVDGRDLAVGCPYHDAKTCQPAQWTSIDAAMWAHTDGAEYPEGTRIRVQRRRADAPRAAWQTHRLYEVGAGATVRRIDRP
jgi:hypothetical protein